MAKNYAAGDAVGNNQMRISGAHAPVKAVAQYYRSNGTSSSVVTMTPNTTAIEVGAQGAAAILRWVYVTDGTGANSSVISTNYDHVIPSGEVRRFVVPIETGSYGVAPNASIVGVAVENGLFQRVAIKIEGVGSVFTTEYGSSNSY